MAMCPLNFTASMIMNLELTKEMQSLNKFGNTNTKFQKKQLNDLNPTIYQKNHLILGMT